MPPPHLPLEVAQMLSSVNPNMALVNQHYHSALRYPTYVHDPNLKYLQAPKNVSIQDLIAKPASIRDPVVLDLSQLGIHNDTFQYLHLPKLLSQYPNVQKLMLQHQKINLPFAACLSSGLMQCPNMTAISLRHCAMKDPEFEIIMNSLVECKNLRHVDLSENKVCNGSNRKYECNLNGLRILASCGSITTIDLSDNGLDGHIDFLATCLNAVWFVGLQTLDLSKNNLSFAEQQKLMSVNRNLQISVENYPR